MTAWLKILLVLILGGILSTLGDRLGTRVGKARLSIFKLRPKSTAVLITVFTGSIISAISFAIMVAFNTQLRVGLFELEDIQAKIKDSVIFWKVKNSSKEKGNANNMFYATRYDYLRIAKAMLDDWQKDTCVGKYLKTIWENRVDKENDKREKEGKRVALLPGGFKPPHAGHFLLAKHFY